MKTKTQALAFPSPEEPEAQELKSWALVELYGHARIVGHYSLTPCDEATVRMLLPSVDGAPSRPYHFQE
jgi:hypothetical protein